MNLTVEFLGLSRVLAQTKESLVTLGYQATFRDVLREVASRFPALFGPIICPDSFELTPAFMLNVDGRRVVHDLDMPASDGQHLIIMFLEAGG